VRLRRALLRLALVALVTLGVLAAGLVVNALRVAPALPAGSATGAAAPPDEAAVQRLSQAITFRTIASDDRAPDPDAFRAFHEFLRAAYPRTHAALERTEVAGSSLLYEWKGSAPHAQPVLFLAHQDVVPATDPDAWTHPPFAGVVADGRVWGRGAMDDKGSLVAWLEAVERLLREGFQPSRTVYFAFGHDEETGGDGARAIAELLAARGVRLEFVLDEGGFVVSGLLPSIEAPVALVGTAEKGYLTVELSAEEEGGHSARPPARTAIGRVSRAIARLEEHPFPARLDGVAEELFARLAPHLPFAQRVVIANRRLLGPVLLSVLEDDPNTATLVRTTTAATTFHAGEKENVLPARARATVNLRILPGDTVDGTVERIRRVIDDDSVQVRVLTAIEPPPASSTSSPAWQLLDGTIREVLGDGVIVAPYLMVAGTDSRHFVPMADDVYRFFPLTLEPDDVARFHGVDERISLGDYGSVIATYYRLLQKL
jgi:carboxypeptidase PM20D1